MITHTSSESSTERMYSTGMRITISSTEETMSNHAAMTSFSALTSFSIIAISSDYE